MIFTDRMIAVRKDRSEINEPIIVYRGDYEIEVRFIIMNNNFKFMDDTNLIESENAAYGQLAILTPYGGNIFSEVAECNEDAVSFVLTKEMLDQIEEVGLYSFQIRLFDHNKESRVSIPPVEFGIEVREPMTSEDQDNSVNNAIVGYSIVKIEDALKEEVPDTFNDDGDYNKTIWGTGNRITEGKLNKIEDALDQINQNEINDKNFLNKQMTSNFNVLQNQIEHIEKYTHNTVLPIDNSEDLVNAIVDNTHDIIDLKKGTYIIDIPVTVKCKILGNGSTINVTSTITTSSSCKLYDINFRGSNHDIDCLNLVSGPIIEGCNFSLFRNAIFQTGISVHGLIKRNTFQYNRNGIYLQNANSDSANNLTIENNYFVKHGTSADDLTADSTEPAFPSSLDTSTQGTGLNDIVGVGLICKSGCNGVFIHNNVFEYNSFCGVLVYQCNGNKTNDVKITSNYFEGNKTSGIVMVNMSTIGGLMQTDVHDNFYARINGQNSDFYSYDLKCIGRNNTALRLVNRIGYRPLWHPVDEETAALYGFHVVREDSGREYYDFVVGTEKQYFQLSNGSYIQPFGVSYEPVPFIFEYKVKLNSPLKFCDGTKTTSAVIKAFEAGEYVGMEIVPGLINSVNYISRALEADEYFRIYQIHPVSMLL